MGVSEKTLFYINYTILHNLCEKKEICPIKNAKKSDWQSVLQDHGACFREPFNMFRGTVQTLLRGNRCSVVLFVYGQTIVCVQANNCLAIGKSLKISLMVPQWMPYGSPTDAVRPLDASFFVLAAGVRTSLPNSEQACSIS